MKKLLIAVMALGLAFSAAAQKGHVIRPARVYVVPRVVVGVGYGFGYPYYPWGYPYYGYQRESKLDMQINDIRAGYRLQIKDVRHDKSLARSERKEKIRALKDEREKEIDQAKRDYYDRSHRRNYHNNNAPNNNAPSGQQDPASQQGEQGPAESKQG